MPGAVSQPSTGAWGKAKRAPEIDRLGLAFGESPSHQPLASVLEKLLVRRATPLLVVRLIVAALLTAVSVQPAAAAEPRYVIHISVDGLRSDAITTLGPAVLPNFYRLRREGAVTDNARTDYGWTITLPNHTSQLTSRPVNGPSGHQYIANKDPDPGATLETNAGSYVASVFDVVHDHGLRTALFSGKTKFVIYEQSYNARTGARDVTGADNGRKKIDAFVINRKSSKLVSAYVQAMADRPFEYSFVHLVDPDTTGHARTWDLTTSPRSAYLDAVQAVDGCLGTILQMIDTTPALKSHTTILLTTDHGGELTTRSHRAAIKADNYIIPFYAWGAGVTRGDLYLLNPTTRRDPRRLRPDYSEAVQPIRSGEMANLALKLLGLPAVPGSTINAAQDLRVSQATTLNAAKTSRKGAGAAH